MPLWWICEIFYESRIGRFEAICPDVDTFREELPQVAEMLEDKKIKNSTLLPVEFVVRRRVHI